jgi:hypothetical protein
MDTPATCTLCQRSTPAQDRICTPCRTEHRHWITQGGPCPSCWAVRLVRRVHEGSAEGWVECLACGVYRALPERDPEEELGFFVTGRWTPILSDVAFTKTVTHTCEGGAERCDGILHTPHGDLQVQWDDDLDEAAHCTVKLHDGTPVLTCDHHGWTRHHPFVQVI